jgi:beta-N-acetylhexosaminidase
MTLGPVMLDLAGLTLTDEDVEICQHPQVGGIILFSRNFNDRAQVKQLVSDIKAVRSPPLLIAVDQEGGRVQRFRNEFTALPALRWLGHLYDLDPVQAREMATLAARIMAQEVLDCGVDFSFAPVLDIDRGCCEVIGDRAIDSRPEGMRQVGMAAVAKHFPGHGGVIGDSHHVLPEDHRLYSDLLDDIRPYISLIEDGLPGIMMAHIRYTRVDPAIASLSSFWMQQVLRRDLNFQGTIFSDDLTMEGASVGGSLQDRALTALSAGADILLVCNNRAGAIDVLQALVGYKNPAAHGRLAAMRADFRRYAAAQRGSADWQNGVERLQAALERPALILDGRA